MTSIHAVAQSLSPDAIITLFTLDTTSIGGPVLNFVQDKEVGGSVFFGEVEFNSVDIEFKGLETSGVGALPTPTLILSNSDGIFQAILNTWGDVLGCPIYRMRTYARFLDGHDEPDSSAYFGPDTFKVERKVDENPNTIEWELSASIDQQGKMIPGRQVIRDTCLWRYRIWNPATATFTYTKAQCPYTGTAYFDINDNPTLLQAEDAPSRRISCCEARFGKGNPLPFGGFPGVARVRA